LVGLVLPAVAAAQPQTFTVGFLAWDACDVQAYETGSGEFGLVVQALDELGYQPGRNLVLECRSSGESDTGFLAAASDLAKAVPDVIVGTSQPAGQAAHEATRTIPIVSIVSGDPVAAGLAESLAMPGGNLTGLTYYATELTAKRLELLKKMIPELATVGVLANPDVAYLPFEEDTKHAASKLGVALKFHQVREPEGLARAFDEMKAEGVEAVFVLPDVMFASQAPAISKLALRHRLPAMAWGTWFAELGCLMAYSAEYDKLVRRLAVYVDKILKGARPGDLPIEQPTTFILSVNLKTADALGITPPESVMLMADQVFE
jgi:putative ABC transport system substrate-binding protein